MHTFYNPNTLSGMYGNPSWVMLVFSNNLGPGVRPSDFEVRHGAGSPNAGEQVPVEEVEVRRELVFLRLVNPVTLAPSLKVTAESTLRDEFGQTFATATIDVFGLSVSDPTTGQFGVVPDGSAARIVAGGYVPGETVTLTGVDGQSQQTLTTMTATENGTISGFPSIPFPVGGPYTLVATGASGRQQIATFNVVSQ